MRLPALLLLCLVPVFTVRAADYVPDAGDLVVATLNLAHGRGQSLNQLLISRDSIRRNLDRVAETLAARDIDLVALQEADAPSWWSGSFNHVDHLAEAAGYPYRFQGEHSRTPLFSFGTALISRIPLENTRSHRFQPSPPTLSKGFVMADIQWHAGNRTARARRVTVVSLHLDFSRPGVRREQIEELLHELSDRSGALVIMGDFNSTGEPPHSILHQLSAALDLQLYQPGAAGLDTYGGVGGGRLDWILVSSGLQIEEYRVLPDELSDHHLLLARLRFPGPR